MKIRDFAQSKLDQMSVPVRFTDEDLERVGGSYQTGEGGHQATITLPRHGLDKKKLSDEETVALIGMAERIENAFRKKIPFYREAARFRELAGIAIVPEGQGTHSEALNAGWFTEIIDQPWFTERESISQSGPDVTMSAIMTWVASRLRKVSFSSNWFVPSDPLVFQLLATDLKGVVVGDLNLPVPAFYVELPDGVFFLDRADTGWHPIRYLVVTEGEVTPRTEEVHAKFKIGPPRLGRRLLIEMYGAPNDKSKSPFDDVWAFHSYQIDDPLADLEQAITSSLSDPEMERTHLKGRIGERVLDGIEVRREVLRFLMNLCVYLGSSDARVEHVHQAEIQRLTRGQKPKKLRKNVKARVQRLLSEKVFRVGSDVTVEPEVRDYVLSEVGTGKKLAYRTVVRGHWRNQAHGPKHSLRKQKWITPHVRGADLPTPVVGHTYEVR